MKIEYATFGAGCFWCVEAVFASLKGVIKVEPGYCGGDTVNPTYEEVCTGNTNHAEVCHIEFDSETIGFEKLLEVFWKVHDPTTLNRQGGDIGTQYRSVIFCHNAEQKHLAESIKEKLEDEKVWDKPVVTVIEDFEVFYPAEDYHFNYFKNNPNQQYCAVVVRPKVEKFKKVFSAYLK
ncbi:MAG: peptide-methionine (S)-S-oxide reductase MsrA [Bacteroidota bacterium]|nr:MAG: peptide-methionine (S)-S-oxide reductase MsrA [Bacteroidota bacterium]